VPTISDGQTALLKFEIENGSAFRKKVALQDLTSLYRNGEVLNAEAAHAFERLICGFLLGETDKKVVRWGLNALARLGTRQGSGLYLSNAIRRFEGEPEIVGAAVAALSKVYNGALDMVADLPSIDPAIRILASMQTTDPRRIEMRDFSIDIDRSDAEVLKLALLLVGLNRDIQNLLHPRHTNGAIIKQLCQHDDRIVRQYSVWSVMENQRLTLGDLGIPFDEIEKQPENVQAKLYQLGAERITDKSLRHDLIYRGTYADNVEVRMGLAKGVARTFYDGIQDITLDWYDLDTADDVKALVAVHFARFSDAFGPYADKVLDIVAVNAKLLDRMLVSSEGTDLYLKLQARDVRFGMVDMFGNTGQLDTMFHHARNLIKKVHVMKVLFLAASPMDQDPLNIGREANDLKAQIASIRDEKVKIDVEHAWAIRADQIQSEMLNCRPEVIHFSGHGDTGLLVFEDRDGNSYVIPGEAMANLIGLVGGVKCVVLNACYSDSMSGHIVPHVEAVIGCDVSIDDNAAAIFTRAFYRALAHGITFEQAYNLARNELDLMGLKGESKKYRILMR